MGEKYPKLTGIWKFQNNSIFNSGKQKIQARNIGISYKESQSSIHLIQGFIPYLPFANNAPLKKILQQF